MNRVGMKRFTLLEVMIVLMLLVILAGAVTPAYLNCWRMRWNTISWRLGIIRLHWRLWSAI